MFTQRILFFAKIIASLGINYQIFQNTLLSIIFNEYFAIFVYQFSPTMKYLLLFLLVSFSTYSSSQNKENKWVIGASSSLVIFQNNSLGESYNSQLPKINLSRYLFSGFSLDGSVSLSGLGDV